MSVFFVCRQKTAYELSAFLVGSEMCIRVTQDSENTEQIAAAVSSNNKALLTKANATIAKLKENGELDKMKAKWVGTTSSSSASASSSAS